MERPLKMQPQANPYYQVQFQHQDLLFFPSFSLQKHCHGRRSVVVWLHCQECSKAGSPSEASRGLKRLEGGLKGISRALEEGLKGAWTGLQGGLKGGLKPSALKGLRGCLKWAWRGLQGGFTLKGASIGLEESFKGAWKGLKPSALKRASRMLQGASRGLERGFKGAWSLQCWKELRGCQGGLTGASRGLQV